jgi:hypothetical protein
MGEESVSTEHFVGEINYQLSPTGHLLVKSTVRSEDVLVKSTVSHRAFVGEIKCPPTGICW